MSWVCCSLGTWVGGGREVGGGRCDGRWWENRTRDWSRDWLNDKPKHSTIHYYVPHYRYVYIYKALVSLLIKSTATFIIIKHVLRTDRANVNQDSSKQPRLNGRQPNATWPDRWPTFGILQMFRWNDEWWKSFHWRFEQWRCTPTNPINKRKRGTNRLRSDNYPANSGIQEPDYGPSCC